MTKRSLRVELADLRINAATGMGCSFVFSDEVRHIICFNDDGTIIYQEGSEAEENKKEAVIKTEQIDRVFIENPTLFKKGMIEIRLNNRVSYRTEIPHNQKVFIKHLIYWLTDKNVRVVK